MEPLRRDRGTYFEGYGLFLFQLAHKTYKYLFIENFFKGRPHVWRQVPPALADTSPQVVSCKGTSKRKRAPARPPSSIKNASTHATVFKNLPSLGSEVTKSSGIAMQYMQCKPSLTQTNDLEKGKAPMTNSAKSIRFGFSVIPMFS